MDIHWSAAVVDVVAAAKGANADENYVTVYDDEDENVNFTTFLFWHIQSPTHWSPLTSKIDLCQRLTVLQVYIFSCDNLILLFEVKLLFEIGNICKSDMFIAVYIF